MYIPQLKVSEFDDIPEAEVLPSQVKEAQAIAGSLLWLSTRTRPDLTFGVAAVCRLTTKNPLRAIEIGQLLLKYVKGSPGYLHYPAGVPNKWGSQDQLKLQRHDRLIEIFADIRTQLVLVTRVYKVWFCALLGAQWRGRVVHNLSSPTLQRSLNLWRTVKVL